MKNDRVHGVSRLIEAHFSGESFEGIDSIPVSWTISMWINLMNRFTTATFITIPVMFTGWSTTGVWCCVPGISVSFHDIHLWAPNSTNIVSIAIVISTGRWIWLLVLIVSWHENHVESGIASTSSLGEVHVPFNASTKKVWSVEHVWSEPTISVFGGEVSSS